MSDEPIIITVPMVRLAEMIETALIKAHTKVTKPSPETLYSVSQTAKLLGISYNTVTRLIQRNRIRATSDGKFISQQAIDDFLNLKK